MPFLPWHPTAVWVMPAAPLELWPCQPLFDSHICWACPVSEPSHLLFLTWILLPSSPYSPSRSPTQTLPWPLSGKGISFILHHNCCFPFIKSPILTCNYLNYLSICFWFVSPFLKGRCPSSGTSMPFTPVPSTGASGQTIDMPVDVQWKATQR